MKKLLLAALISASACASYGQGTILFVNGPTTRVRWTNESSHAGGFVPTTAGTLYYGAFAVLASAASDAASASNLMTMATSSANLGVNSSTTAGVISPPFGTSSTPYPLAGYAEGTTVWLQIRAWDQRAGNTADSWKSAIGTLDYLYGASAIQQFTLGAPGGPATAIWGTTAGRIPGFAVVVQVPEPSTIALVGVGLAGLLFLRRRK